MKPTSFEHACQVKGYDPAKVLPDVSMVPGSLKQAVLNFIMLCIITEAINYNEETKEQWEPDWDDRSQQKWVPWFDMEVDENNPSGFRFGASFCGHASTGSAGGSRLCYQNSEDSKFAATTFTELFRGMMVLPKS